MLQYRYIDVIDYVVMDGYGQDLGHFQTEEEAQAHIDAIRLTDEYDKEDAAELYIEKFEYEEMVLDVPPSDYD